MPRPHAPLPRLTLLVGLLLAAAPVAAPVVAPAWAQKAPTAKPAEAPAERIPPAAETPPPEPPVQIIGLRVEIVERGLYQTSTGTIRQMPNGIGENLVDAVELERSTTHIPARPGVSFGLEFVVHGRPAGTMLNSPPP